MTLLLLPNDMYKLESLQDGSRTRQEIPQTAGCKAIVSLIVVFDKERQIPGAGAFH